MTRSIPQIGIYVIANTKNGKVYIGQAIDIKVRWRQHRNSLKRGNHHNEHLQRAWNKYGAKAFKFQVLEYCTEDQLNEREIHYIAIYQAKKLSYNMSGGGEKSSDYRMSEETKRKISLSAMGNTRTRGKPLSESHRQKIANALRGKKHSPEHIQKVADAKRGEKWSEESRAKLSSSRKGKKRPPFTEEHLRHMSESRKGIPLSEETRKKMSLARIGNKNNLGNKASEETRRKMSEAHKRRNEIKEDNGDSEQ